MSGKFLPCFSGFSGLGEYVIWAGKLQIPKKKCFKRVFWLSFGLTIFIYLMLAATSIGADADGIPLSGLPGFGAG
jgi:amino acid efflux transporter